MRRTIICRGKISDGCLDGERTARQFGTSLDAQDDPPMQRDETYNGSSIVCTPCFDIVVPFTPSGLGRHVEMADAIRHVRALQRQIVSDSDEALRGMIELANEDMRQSSSFSYPYKSAKAAKMMALAELDARERDRRASASEAETTEGETEISEEVA